jgi:hypothetical protein
MVKTDVLDKTELILILRSKLELKARWEMYS